MTPNQMLRAIRALEARIDKLEANTVLDPIKPIAIRVKRAYNRKNPTALEAPENAKTNRRTAD